MLTTLVPRANHNDASGEVRVLQDPRRARAMNIAEGFWRLRARGCLIRLRSTLSHPPALRGLHVQIDENTHRHTRTWQMTLVPILDRLAAARKPREIVVVLTMRQSGSSWGWLGGTPIRSHPNAGTDYPLWGWKSAVAWNGAVEIWGSAEGDETHPQVRNQTISFSWKVRPLRKTGGSARRTRLAPSDSLK